MRESAETATYGSCNEKVPFEELHISDPILPEEFEAGCLNIQAYRPEDISKVVFANVRRPHEDTMTPRQKAALVRFQYQGSVNLGDPGNYEDMKKFFDIFNDLFYGGLISGWKLRLIEPRDKLYGGSVDAFCDPQFPGCEKDPRFKIGRPTSTICMNRPGGIPYGNAGEGTLWVI